MDDHQKEKLYSAEVNGMHFTFTQAELDEADVVDAGNGRLHMLDGPSSIQAHVLDAARGWKEQKMEMDGEIFHVQLSDELDVMLNEMGFQAAAGRELGDIKAPMPGLVLQVHVEEGQQVMEGDKLLILVAMKMENSILAQQGAVVKKVHVEAGIAVDKGQVLIELE
ncbi:MAG: biotin/lipoyl-containing protein [Flavisolibacter sp.]